MIEHTLLRADMKRDDVRQLCEEAIHHDFFGVCVCPYWITTAKEFLKDRNIKIIAALGFPMGNSMPKIKAMETKLAVEAGADEVDVVMNVSAALDGHWDFVEHEIHDIVSSAQGRIVKIILETCLLSPDQIVRGCRAIERGGAQFVQTSTGFAAMGATEEAVELIRATVDNRLGIKASGGIKDRETVEAMLAAGATRLGSSNGVAIMNSPI
ncbi:MAG: deoxyribose-phosphate aldolase [Verrucomicrobiota bacterium]